MVTEKFLNTLAESHWENFCLLYPAMVRYNCPKIILNNRLSKTAGRCFVTENLIDMSAKVYRKEANIVLLNSVTLPHELAHQVDFNLNGYPKNNRWHGPTWKAIMIRFGLPPDTYHTMTLD